MKGIKVLACIVVIVCAGVPALTQSVAFALNVSAPAINAHLVWGQGINGSGVRVAVLDSGIDKTHPSLADRVVRQVDFTGEGPADLLGHGTHVAGIIASTNETYKGVAYGCQLVNIKVVNIEGHWMPEWYEKGVDWCINNKTIRIINVSFGEYPPRCDGTCRFCKKAEEAIEAGIIVVASAGNEGSGAQTINSPGASFNVITVGAIDDKDNSDISNDELWQLSSRGPTQDNRPKPDVVAPGVRIRSCRADNLDIRQPGWDSFIDRYNVESTGTSMAAPHVSGTVALMLQKNPNLTPAQVKAMLRQTSRLNDNLNRLTVNDCGYGIIDAKQAVDTAPYPAKIRWKLMCDEYVVTSKEGFQMSSVTFTVNRTGNGIDLTNIYIYWWQVSVDVYEIFESVKTPYLWIDGTLYKLGAYQYYLAAGPRVSEKKEGCVTIRATYRISDVTATLNYYVSVNKTQPYLLLSSSSSHTYNKTLYLDVELRDNDQDYVTYSNGTTIYNEIKLCNKEIHVKDYQFQKPYLQFMPMTWYPNIWILKYSATEPVYENPDIGLNGESVNNADIVLYYEHKLGFPGPQINVIRS